MSLTDDQANRCPYCRCPLDIVLVKFKFCRTATVSCCPNCALVSAARCDDRPNIAGKA
jgi:hypothetical protein